METGVLSGHTFCPISRFSAGRSFSQQDLPAIFIRLAVVADPVGDDTRRNLVPEDLRPADYPDVGRDHGRPPLVAGVHKLEEQVVIQI